MEKQLTVGSEVRIKCKTVWKGTWTIIGIWYNKLLLHNKQIEYLEVMRIRKNGRKWTRIINQDDIVEVIFNPSKRMN